MCPAFDPSMPPLGLAYLSSYLKQQNFSSYVIDMNINLYHKADKDYRKLWNYEYTDRWLNEYNLNDILDYFHKDIEEQINHILSSNVKIIGFSVHLSNFKFAFQIAKRIKEKDPKRVIVFGGAQCFAIENGYDIPLFFYLDRKPRIDLDVVDIFVVGEGEEITAELISKIKQNKCFFDIPGTIVYNKGRFSTFKPRLPIQQLDKISFPRFQEFSLNKYTSDTLPIITSRGCIYNCSFCNNPYLSHNYRFRTADNVFEEIKYHYTQSGLKHFSFCDLLINGNLRQLEHLCDLIINSGYDIHWESMAANRKEMSQELLIKMKKAGCDCLAYGLESGSELLLRKMRKKYTPSDATKILKLTKQAGVKTKINIIVGLPGEGEKEFYETVRFIESNAVFIDEISSCNICFIMPKSELELEPQKYGIILGQENHWLKWRTTDGTNTNPIRVQRAKELVNIISNLKIPMNVVSIFDNDYVKKLDQFDKKCSVGK
jgi:radical SAM superfamily enzyme YgiQ (UPF0313 family)